MDKQEAPNFLTVAEVADTMRVSKMTVYRLVHGGELPAVRVGRSYRVPQAAVAQMFASGLGNWADTTGTGSAGDQDAPDRAALA